MEKTVAHSLVNQALTEYDAAMEQLNKSHKDFVMIAAVEQVKKSITDFLKAFLVEKGEENFPENDLLRIQKICAGYDKRFDDLHLDSIALLSEDDSMVYTNDLTEGRLNRYIKTMESTRGLVLELLR